MIVHHQNVTIITRALISFHDSIILNTLKIVYFKILIKIIF